jgi:cytochrome c551/c552
MSRRSNIVVPTSAFDRVTGIPCMRYIDLSTRYSPRAMVKVLIAALLGTVAGIAVMIGVIVIAGSDTSDASSLGLSVSLSTATPTGATSTPASTPATSGGGSTSSSSGGTGNASAGKAVFASNGCGSCHTLQAAAATGTIGPDLDKIAADATKAGMPLDAFIQQSITDPAAFTASGGPWSTPMPTSFGSSLSSTQIADLVALISSSQS